MFDVFYINHPAGIAHERKADSIEHARELCRTRYLWIVDGLNDYSGFDFLWEPVPWENQQAHVWPSQYQENGGTWLIPRTGYTDVNRNHVTVSRTQRPIVVGIDHGTGIDFECDVKTRFISDYLGTLRRVLGKVNAEYAWVCSSVCDYKKFDFCWHPSEWQTDMLHVFPSQLRHRHGWLDNIQKFGDTFYVHIPSFLKKSENLALLEWFDTINFVQDIRVDRHRIPTITHSYDSHVQAVWEHNFQEPVVQFSVHGAVDSYPVTNLWRQETRAIVPVSTGAGAVVVPREAKNFIKHQLYDYPVIDKRYEKQRTAPYMDIVFISNGEVNADHNFKHMCEQKWRRDQSNRIVRIDGINGRVAAYQAAARASRTPWFFAVFAKIEIDEWFDWYWQPDRMQEPKHYIFHARNPVNGLKYGHQAVIAYNRDLVLSNTGAGLDFTLDQPHTVVPILSGTAHYANSAWMCWRTAFREALKLRHSLPDVENEYRLEQWLKPNNENAYYQWSHCGAEDAMEYYDRVGGDFDELKKSYEWDWLVTHAMMKHNLTPDQ